MPSVAKDWWLMTISLKKAFLKKTIWDFSNKRAKWSLIAHLSLFKAYISSYLLKAGHVPGDTWGGANFGPWCII